MWAGWAWLHGWMDMLWFRFVRSLARKNRHWLKRDAAVPLCMCLSPHPSLSVEWTCFAAISVDTTRWRRRFTTSQENKIVVQLVGWSAGIIMSARFFFSSCISSLSALLLLLPFHLGQIIIVFSRSSLSLFIHSQIDRNNQCVLIPRPTAT